MGIIENIRKLELEHARMKCALKQIFKVVTEPTTYTEKLKKEQMLNAIAHMAKDGLRECLYDDNEDEGDV